MPLSRKQRLELIENPEWLRYKHKVEGMSVPALARILGCGCCKVVSRLKKFSIKRNPRGFNLSAAGRDNYMKIPGVKNPFLGHRHTDEVRAKLSEKRGPNLKIQGSGNGMYGRTGGTNPNWKGGITPGRQSAYAQMLWKRVKRAVFSRDGYRCCNCGKMPVGYRQRQTHHILGWTKHPERRFDRDNIITICRSCHEWVHSRANRYKRWIGEDALTFFTSLLADNR